MWLKFIKRKPHVWHLREFGFEDYNFKFIFGKRISSLLFNKGGNVFIAISKAICKYYRSFIDPNKIQIIYNGISKKNYSIVDKKYNEILEFCCVGILDPNKNQLEILKSFAYLINVHQYDNIKLNIIGNGPQEYEQDLQKFITLNNLDSYVKLYGYVEDVPTLLKKMDIGIISSVKEGFGRVSVEYMLNKMPVIASDTGANEEIVQDKITGLIYKQGDYISLANCIKKLILNKNIIKDFGANGYSRAYDLFISEINTKNIWKIYNDVKEKDV